jgi:hypothetical protein
MEKALGAKPAAAIGLILIQKRQLRLPHSKTSSQKTYRRRRTDGAAYFVRGGTAWISVAYFVSAGDWMGGGDLRRAAYSVRQRRYQRCGVGQGRLLSTRGKSAAGGELNGAAHDVSGCDQISAFETVLRPRSS